MCELASWIPNAVAATLRAETAPPIVEWLTTIRSSIEEYDPLVTVAPPSPEPETPEDKFDEILSTLGNEIFKLEQYQRFLSPSENKVSLSILNIFDDCLEGMSDGKQTKHSDSECESTLSDVSFVTSTPASVKENINTVFDKPNAPRTRLKSDRSVCSDSNSESDSYSESTCWSYKDCSTDDNEVHPYAAVWSHSSGYHNSNEILRQMLSQHSRHATISRLSFDTASDFIPDRYSVYSLHEVGECKDRCDSVPVAMTPERPADDGYEPVRDAVTDENIYEEIEYNCSYTDEGCSCGGSVEVESCSISASSEGAGRESPLYANLRDHDAYAVPADVIYWKNLLLDPFFNDDEEDDWITPEECAVYSRDQRPPLVIPRITQYRTPRNRPQPVYPENEDRNSMRGRQYEQLNNWSPSSERSRLEFEQSFNKSSSDSPPFVRINKRLGGSTENLLGNARRPTHLQIPASSSGDSLDVEIREREPSYVRNRKSRSMVASKHRIRSPVPAPRYTVHQTPEERAILEGPVKRTKFLEGVKKIKKNWVESYMVLTPTALVFYKDHRTYYAPKVPRPPGTPPSPSTTLPELVLPLHDAHVVDCIQKHTKRYNRSFVLTVSHDQYLIQDETEIGAKRWLEHIKDVIYKLYPRSMAHESPIPYPSSTDQESLGRTPPVSRHKTKQKDEPVFGRNLEEVCPQSSPRVPEFVVACIKEIESSEDNMCTDGLYRASGNLSQVQKIRLEVDQNKMSVIENSPDIHVLTGSLKLFFRELKEPLIPFSMFNKVLAACSVKPREARVKEFQNIVQALPQCNRETLKYLLEHLLRVTQYSERNRMHTANLAIVFGPTLLWAPAEQADNIAVDCIQQNNVVDILLTDFKEIFTENGNKGKKKG